MTQAQECYATKVFKAMEYIYRGDRLTDPKIKGKTCDAVRKNGKCIRGRNGNMVVKFEGGETAVILARQLRKIK